MATNGLRKRSTKQQVVSLLREFASQIQAMEDSEVERVLLGECRLEIRPIQKKPNGRGSRTRCSDEAFGRLQKALQDSNTREHARELIDGSLHTRAELARFARLLDIPVPKSTSSEQLRDRLVEGTVGYRIRSAAIRGNAATY